ncbi:hypothetical protein [Streptomyces mesophilus]|uniref:hypothetical protein n=1 Tax=Streptomyces mesophilus TaxID=1775132 RepID=UPI00331CC556
MIEIAVLLVGGCLGWWLVSRKVRQRAQDAAAGVAIKVPCMVRRPDQDRRWTRGRLVTGAGETIWERRGLGPVASLPAGLRQVGMRKPSRGEAVRINGRAWIIECASDDGAVLIGVMPPELEHVSSALRQAV